MSIEEFRFRISARLTKVKDVGSKIQVALEQKAKIPTSQGISQGKAAPTFDRATTPYVYKETQSERELMATAKLIFQTNQGSNPPPQSINVPLAIFETGGKLYILMTTALYDLNEHKVSGFIESGDDVVVVLRALFSAIDYLHSIGIVHQDVNPANVLVYKTGDGSEDGSEDGFDYKLSDYDKCAIADQQGVYPKTNSTGTVSYAAPEAFLPDTPVTPALDIWSLALTLFFAMHCTLPWRTSNFFDDEFALYYDYYHTNAGSSPLAIYEGRDEKMKHTETVISELLRFEPKDRLDKFKQMF